MTKITVYRYDEMNSPAQAEGWFTLGRRRGAA
jgi:hypothetical protein